MKNWKMTFVIAAGVVAAGSILSTFLAKPLMAQVRAALVKDVDNPSRQPFSVGTGITNFAPNVTGATDTVLTVPAGKRAVVEHVSCINFLDNSNNWIRFEMNYTSGGASSSQQFVNARVGPSFAANVDIWSFSQPVRAYADPSTAIVINILRRTGTGLAGFECYISGHYVDTTL